MIIARNSSLNSPHAGIANDSSLLLLLFWEDLVEPGASIYALFWYKWHFLSYFIIKAGKMSLPCLRSSFFMLVQWLNNSLIILTTLLLSSKWAVKRSIFMMISTKGMSVVTLLALSMIVYKSDASHLCSNYMDSWHWIIFSSSLNMTVSSRSEYFLCLHCTISYILSKYLASLSSYINKVSSPYKFSSLFFDARCMLLFL